MAGVVRDTYTFGYGGATYAVKLPQGYYSSINTKVGFTKASDSAVKGKFVLSVREAVKFGALVKIGILYKKGTRLQRSEILCTADKMQTALQELEGDTYRGNVIRSAYITQQRRLG